MLWIFRLFVLLFSAVVLFPSLVHYDRFISVLAIFVGKARTTRVPEIVFDRFHFYGIPAAVLFFIIGNVLVVKRAFVKTWLLSFIRDAKTLGSDLKTNVLREAGFAPGALPGTEKRLALLALILITCCAAILRANYLYFPMRSDESASYLFWTEKSAFTILSLYTDPCVHMFHNLTQRIFFLLFGNSPASLRMPDFISGVAMVPLTYLTARMLFTKASPLAGLVAAFFVATNSALVEYSVNARGYGMQICFFLVMICIAQYLKLSGFKNFAAWVGLPVFAFLGFWTIPTMLYPFVGFLIWFWGSTFFELPQNSRFKFTFHLGLVCVAAFILTLGGYSIAWIFRPAVNTFNDPAISAGSAGGLSLATLSVTTHGVWANLHRDFDFLGGKMVLLIGTLLLLLFILSQLLEVVVLKKLPLGLSCILGLAVIFCTHQRSPHYIRIYNYLIPIYFIGVASLINYFRFSQLQLRALFVIVLLSTVGLSSLQLFSKEVPFFKEPYQSLTVLHPEALMEALKENKLTADDCVGVRFPDRLVLLYYFERAGLPWDALEKTDCTYQQGNAKRYFSVVTELRWKVDEALLPKTNPNYKEPTLLKQWGPTSLWLYKKVGS